MSQCQCREIESLFDQRLAADQLERVRRRGPLKSTRLLLEALRLCGVHGSTLLDIGGGVGAVHLQLLASGAGEATDVDASSAYLGSARSEAERLGLGSRVRYHHGNFLDLAAGIPPADIVTLDRVICCYDDMAGLVGASAAKARRLYGLVYPRDAWWTRLGIRLMNLGHRFWGRKFRVFAHSTAAVESILAAHGLAKISHRTAGFWQVAVFDRPGTRA
ncbi:MAG: class I SAM-dependent methyltransferase [Spirochaetia bacterium]